MDLWFFSIYSSTYFRIYCESFLGDFKGFYSNINRRYFRKSMDYLNSKFTLRIITLASMFLAFLYKMVRHLTEIQQQELNLSKISMLARDVSDSEHNSLEEEVIQKLRIDRKMKLIREFLNSEFNRYQTFIDKEEQIKDTKFIKINLPFKVPFTSRTNE